ncbi:hypothetical protein ACE1CI_30465 [Aerosakkonemataceae cyanobacterium BLCC-F50]|uniref:Uncharacterized protein n=1 Tax=Floridaenema flaviceps BLCC-F50 TaxID=3153642 RepID=A0ABV4Y009_9CYAN
MLVETWISDNGTSTSIPAPLPSEMQNREIRTSGYGGVRNDSNYATGKIEGWAGGRQKFVIQHPLLVGARWAYCNGLWLILIVRNRYHSMTVGFTVKNPVLPPGSTGRYSVLSGWAYFLTHLSFGVYYPYKELFIDAFEPYIFHGFFDNTNNIPNHISVRQDSLNIRFKELRAEDVGAEVLVNQVSSYDVFFRDAKYIIGTDQSPYSYSTGFVGGTIRDVSVYCTEQRVSWGWGLDYGLYQSGLPGTVVTPTVSDIETKAKKWRVSPYNSNFLEYAIDILNRPCPIQITVDPALNPTGDDHFCMDYQDYDGLLNSFNRIEERLNELPQ